MSSRTFQPPSRRSQQMSLQGVLGHTNDKERRKRILLAVALTSILWGAVYLYNHRPPARDYVLVIDAGSSGTRMYAYSWERPRSTNEVPRLELLPPEAAPHKVPRRAMPNRRAYKRVETEPGLDAYAANPAALEVKALKPLLEWAAAAIPHSAWEHTPVFLFGTAGLRRLSSDDQTRVLSTARDVLTRSGLRFTPQWARVLTGKDEGVFGWIALNLAAGTLKQGQDSSTLGMLDLGGSSLEVAFAGDNDQSAKNSGSGLIQGNVSILGDEIPLFSHTHQRYGLDDAYDRAVTYLLESQLAMSSEKDDTAKKENDGASSTVQTTTTTIAGSDNSSSIVEANTSNSVEGATLDDTAAAASKTTGLDDGQAGNRVLLAAAEANTNGGGPELPRVQHPCLHAGFTTRYTRSHPITQLPHITEVELVGRPNYDDCRRLAEVVVNASIPCETATTALPHKCILGHPQPQFPGKFVALTGFYVVHNFFSLRKETGFNGLHEIGEKFCHTPWKEVVERHPNELHVEHYCFRAPYIHALLEKGLKLRPDHVTVGSGDAGWTLGAALSEGGRLAGVGSPQVSIFEYWKSMNIAAGVVFAAAVVFVVVGVALSKTIFPPARRFFRARFGDGGSDWLPSLENNQGGAAVGNTGGGAGRYLTTLYSKGSDAAATPGFHFSHASPFVGPAVAAYDKKHTPATRRTVALSEEEENGGATLLQSSRTMSRSQMFSRRLTTSFAGGGENSTPEPSL